MGDSMGGGRFHNPIAFHKVWHKMKFLRREKYFESEQATLEVGEQKFYESEYLLVFKHTMKSQKSGWGLSGKFSIVRTKPNASVEHSRGQVDNDQLQDYLNSISEIEMGEKKGGDDDTNFKALDGKGGPVAGGGPFKTRGLATNMLKVNQWSNMPEEEYPNKFSALVDQIKLNEAIEYDKWGIRRISGTMPSALDGGEAMAWVIGARAREDVKYGEIFTSYWRSEGKAQTQINGVHHRDTGEYETSDYYVTQENIEPGPAGRQFNKGLFKIEFYEKPRAPVLDKAKGDANHIDKVVKNTDLPNPPDFKFETDRIETQNSDGEVSNIVYARFFWLA